MSDVVIRSKEIVLVPLDQIKLNPANMNSHPPEQIERLVKIIKETGFRTPGTISNRTGILIAGEGRYLAAKKLGMKAIPCIYEDFDSEEQEFAHGVADNALQGWSQLDLSGINQKVQDLGPFDVDLMGMQNFTIDPFDKSSLDEDNSTEDPDEIEDGLESEPDPYEMEDDEESDETIAQNEQIPDQIKHRTTQHDHFKIGMHELYNGDCLERMKLLPNESVDALVSDPPAGIAFMGKDWDEDKGGGKEWTAWMKRVMDQSFRVLKPGAHGLVWAIPRTAHWTMTAMEDAGFEIRDVIVHVFGSGFPKSMDISKAIDKAAGVKREVVGKSNRHTSHGKQFASGGYADSDNCYITSPATEAAKQWQGFGTALKPASEHWILVRKPISEKTVAANVLLHGVGGINVDSSRIGTGDDRSSGGIRKAHQAANEHSIALAMNQNERPTGGRFPSNFVLSHNPDCVEVGTKKVKPQGGAQAGSKIKNKGTAIWSNGSHVEMVSSQASSDGETVPDFECTNGCAVGELDRQSGASRFFKCFAGNVNQNQESSENSNPDLIRFQYQAKPSKREKNEGVDESIKKAIGARPNSGDMTGKFPDHDQRERIGNFHPTVKSIRLMQYLITMVTPPQGTLIDPFGGSGTTLVAAHLKGFKAILFEQSTEYCDIILARAEKAVGTQAELLN